MLAIPASAAAQDAAGGGEELDAPHVRIYRRVAPATVAVRGSRDAGSGVIIDGSGIILTSPTACGAASEAVTVTLQGHRQHRGRVMGRVNDKELVLVKIDAQDLPAVELGDSDDARVGQVVYALGDSFGSIQKDGQPAISMGVVSGLYEVSKRQRGTYYTGKVIETSAAVNPDQDGGPLVDRHGRLLGIVTLNYDESKFTGIAIPINELKPHIERIRRQYDSGGTPPSPGGSWLGAEVRPAEGGLEVTRVSPRGPAEKAGVRKGDLLRRADNVRLITRAALEKLLQRKAPGETVKIELARDGSSVELTITLGRKPVY